jgi:hypothetical protein
MVRRNLEYRKSILQLEEAQAIQRRLLASGIDSNLLSNAIEPIVDSYLDHVLWGQFGSYEGNIIQYVHQIREYFGILPGSRTHVTMRLELYYTDYDDIVTGKLPSEETTLSLDPGEQCHYSSPFSSFYRETKEGLSGTEGELVFSSKRLIFRFKIGGGHEVSWKRVLRAEVGAYNVLITTVDKAATWDTPKEKVRRYRGQEPFRLVAIANTLINKANEPSPTRRSRHISTAVMQAVWVRDEGRCVLCGSYEELQFDHIIPYSLGGANTEENIRLLCRTCNQQRGNRM